MVIFTLEPWNCEKCSFSAIFINLYLRHFYILAKFQFGLAKYTYFHNIFFTFDDKKNNHSRKIVKFPYFNKIEKKSLVFVILRLWKIISINFSLGFNSYIKISLSRSILSAFDNYFKNSSRENGQICISWSNMEKSLDFAIVRPWRNIFVHFPPESDW